MGRRQGAGAGRDSARGGPGRGRLAIGGRRRSDFAVNTKFSRPDADIYVDEAAGTLERAFPSLRQLCVAAHQDDIEIMAYSGIVECLEAGGPGFGGVVVTNGAGSPRSGTYSKFTDEEMQAVRRAEQRKAARLGNYLFQIQLAHPSAAVRSASGEGSLVAADLDAIFGSARVDTVYLHNPADKHDTHVAVFLRCLEALRRLPAASRPRRVLGCAVWRDLEWMLDGDRVALESGRRPELALALLRTFDSQVAGGKRYDLAAVARRQAHATFDTPREVDAFEGITWAMDLTPLVADPAMDVGQFTLRLVDRLRNDIAERLKRLR